MELDIAGVTARVAGCRVDDVTLHAIDYDYGSPATAGLWQAVAANPQGERRLFVKLLRHPRLWPALDRLPEGARSEFVESFPWRFELDIARSGISEVLPDGMRAPQLHHVEVFDDDHIGLWSEFVHERPGRWTLDELARAARLLGRLAARRREGAAVNERLPAVCHTGRGMAMRYFVERRVMLDALGQLDDDDLWGHPAYRGALSGAEASTLRDELRSLAPLLPQLLDELDALPQTFAHGDASVQNILITTDGHTDLVVIDWGLGTLLPVGFDLGQLLVGPMHAGLVDAEQVGAIDPVIFEAYLAGLADEGFDALAADVRFGYLGSLLGRSVFTSLPTVELERLDPTSADRLVRQRLALTRELVDLTAPVVRDRLDAASVSA